VEPGGVGGERGPAALPAQVDHPAGQDIDGVGAVQMLLDHLAGGIGEVGEQYLGMAHQLVDEMGGVGA
jgi:hypothetical protein